MRKYATFFWYLVYYKLKKVENRSSKNPEILMSISVAFYGHFLPIFIHLKIQTQSPSTEKVKITILNIKAALTYKGRKLGIRPTKHKVKAILIPIFLLYIFPKVPSVSCFGFASFRTFRVLDPKSGINVFFCLVFQNLLNGGQCLNKLIWNTLIDLMDLQPYIINCKVRTVDRMRYTKWQKRAISFISGVARNLAWGWGAVSQFLA